MAIGIIVLVCGGAGILAGGFVTDSLCRRGDARGPPTAALAGAALLRPFPLLATTSESPGVSLAAFAPIVFLSAFCFGPAVGALQLATPPPLRVRV